MPHQNSVTPAEKDEWDELLSRVMQVQEALDEAITHVRLAESALLREALGGRVQPLMLAGTCHELEDALGGFGANIEDLDIEPATAQEHLTAAAEALDAIAVSDRPADLVLVRAQLALLHSQVDDAADRA